MPLGGDAPLDQRARLGEAGGLALRIRQQLQRRRHRLRIGRPLDIGGDLGVGDGPLIALGPAALDQRRESRLELVLGESHGGLLRVHPAALERVQRTGRQPAL